MKVLINICKKTLLFITLLLFLSIILISIFLYPTIKEGYQLSLEKENYINYKTFNLLTNETMVDGEGNSLSKIVKENNNYKYLKYNHFPEKMIKGYIAVEDKRFLSHNGIDYISIGRAGISIIKNNGKITQGGSSITQQLVKNTLLTQERTLLRKIAEFLLTYKVEDKFSKNDILEFYLNTNYYGHGCYGVYSISQKLYGKEPKNLEIDEIAMIVGLSNGPALFDPIRHPEAAINKRNFVLSEMLSQNIISEKEYNISIKKELNIKTN